MEPFKSLTYYDGTSPHIAQREARQHLKAALKLDTLLAKSISNLHQLTFQDISRSSEELLLHFIKQNVATRMNVRNIIGEVDAYESIVNSVCNWLEVLFVNAKLTQDQKAVLNKSLFANDLGRAGFSMLVQMGSILISSKAGVTPIHFSQGYTGWVAAPYSHPSTYTRFYSGSEPPFTRTEERELASGQITCSFGKMSKSVIEKISSESNSPQLNIFLKSFLAITEPISKGAALADRLNKGIQQRDGLIYKLCERIST